MNRVSKSQQSYRKKIHHIGNPFINQKDQKNEQSLNALLVYQDQNTKSHQNQQSSVEDKNHVSQSRVQSPQSNRSRQANNSYHQSIRSPLENPLFVTGQQAIHQLPHQQSITNPQQKFIDQELLVTNSPWMGIKRDQIRTASPTQGRKKNFYKDYFSQVDNGYQIQGMMIKNDSQVSNSQYNQGFNNNLQNHMMQQSFNTKSQQLQHGNSPVFKNFSLLFFCQICIQDSYFSSQGAHFNQTGGGANFFSNNYSHQLKSNPIKLAATTASIQEQNVFSSIQSQQNLYNIKARPSTYTSHRLFRPQKLGLVSQSQQKRQSINIEKEITQFIENTYLSIFLKIKFRKQPSNYDLKQVVANNNNSNYYYLTDKNKEWNVIKNNWIGSLSGCLYSQAVKINDNINLKNKNFENTSQIKKKYIIREVNKQSIQQYQSQKLISQAQYAHHLQQSTQKIQCKRQQTTVVNFLKNNFQQSLKESSCNHANFKCVY